MNSKSLKTTHEVRDPVHVFVRLSNHERRVVDSQPFQRLRHIQQLALTHLVYPGATHKRFEHSLGVMELASRMYDTLTNRNNIKPARGLLPDSVLDDDEVAGYWRRVVRMAALCHDIGHIPFSHAAEKALLPEEWHHERLTAELIKSDEMQNIWADARPALKTDDIVKLAVGPEKATEYQFTDWEAVLADIISGDALGADRIDYLLRDSLHTGVAYGRFDHNRLIDTLRILPTPGDIPTEPRLGVEVGGLLSAEALLLARYFMYTQVYLHPVRRIYDIHLKEFLQAWLPGGRFSINLADHQKMTDVDVEAALTKAADNSDEPGHDPASRIRYRRHFRVLYDRNPNDERMNRNAAKLVTEAAIREFGIDKVRYDAYLPPGEAPDLPVLKRDHRTVSSQAASSVMAQLPQVRAEFVFVAPEILAKAEKWLERYRNDIIVPDEEKEDGRDCT